MTVDDSLARQVREVIESGSPLDEDAFAALCLAVAEAQGSLRPDAPARGLEAIEPLPEAAFKLMTVAHFPPSEAQAVFHTSGTTRGTPGRHLVRDASLYRVSVLRGFERFAMYPPRPGRFVSLIPAASERPHSSLSYMISYILETYPQVPPPRVRDGDRLDLATIRDALESAVRAREPVLLLGTTLDFLTFFEAVGSWGVRLPPGSRAMHTGGAKASGRAVDREDLWGTFARVLGIPAEDVIEEYGMTELLSQAYDSPRVTPGPRRLVPVPWMRTRVLDPLTWREVAPGERGLLCHHDLANVWTAVAILTGDLATRVGDGFAQVERAPGASPRGCSHEAAR